jgi:hypothetical protein
MTSPFGGVQRTRLGQDRFGNADLPDVVEECAVGDGLEIGRLQAGLGPEPGGEVGQALAVVLRARVLGLDGIGERGHRGMCRVHRTSA